MPAHIVQEGKLVLANREIYLADVGRLAGSVIAGAVLDRSLQEILRRQACRLDERARSRKLRETRLQRRTGEICRWELVMLAFSGGVFWHQRQRLRRQKGKQRLDKEAKEEQNPPEETPEQPSVVRTSSGKGKGKGPPPAPKGLGKGKACRGSDTQASVTTRRGEEATKIPASPQIGDAPFGKRIHWVKPMYQDPDSNSIFGMLKGDSSKVTLDRYLLRAMFTDKTRRPVRKLVAPKPQGLCILDSVRATNIGVRIKQLPMSSQDLVECINSLNTVHARIRADDVQILEGAMPTEIEARKLAGVKKPEELRDVEKQLLPLCSLSPAAVRIFNTALTHQNNYLSLMRRCHVVQQAAREVCSSPQLRDLFCLFLQAGNYINSGDVELKVQAFGIESLKSVGAFKVGTVTTLHFLCISKRSVDHYFLADLKASLQHLAAAAKEKAQQLKGEVSSFEEEARIVATRVREQRAHAEEDDFRAAMTMSLQESVNRRLLRERSSMLAEDVANERRMLLRELDNASQASARAQAFFGGEAGDVQASAGKSKAVTGGADPKLLQWQDFFGLIFDFVSAFESTWNEIEQSPSLYLQYEVAAAALNSKLISWTPCQAAGSSAPTRSPSPASTPTDSSRRTSSSRQGREHRASTT